MRYSKFPPFTNNQFDIGDKVWSKTAVGLELAHQPTDGSYNQKQTVSSILTQCGQVIAIHDVIIDYSTWGELYKSVGKIRYRSCLIQHPNGVGWAGSGALVAKKSQQLK